MRKRAQIVLLLSAMMLLSSCKWIRWIKINSQIKKFDKNFTYVRDNGTDYLRFNNPVLLESDLKLLTGKEPSKIIIDNGLISHIYLCEREKHRLKDGSNDLKIQCFFNKDKKLYKLVHPQQLSNNMNEDTFKKTGIAIFSGKISVSRWTIEGTYKKQKNDNYNAPTFAEVKKALGQPDSQTENEKLVYTYKIKTRTKPSKKVRLDVKLIYNFDKTTSRVSSILLDFASIKLVYNYKE